jgi:chromosome segregation ATPase
MKEERERMENELREEFSSVKRPLKKYEHILRNDRSIQREKRISFEKIMHSPVKAILSEGGESVLKEMISRVEEAIESRKISLKESEEKKFTEFSESVREGRISELRKKHAELGGRIEESEREKEKENVSDEREKIKREIEHLENEISEYWRNLDNIKKGKDSVKKEILEEKENLEKMIEREIGKKFAIKLS